MIERWKYLHDWWIEDITFEYSQRTEFIMLLRKHPEDSMGGIFRDMIKVLDKRIIRMKREYKKIYGVNYRARQS